MRWPAYVDGVSNLAHKIVDLTDARALVLLVEMDERVFVVVRSRTETIDAAAVAGVLRRRRACAGRVGDSALRSRSARARVVDALATTSGRTRPRGTSCRRPHALSSPDASVRDAMTLCQRHGQSGVFVVDDGRLVGGVGREDLDKAVSHDLAHAPVRGIMSSRVVTRTRTRRSSSSGRS